MIDLNQQEEQREAAPAMPPGSMVKVRLNIRQPKQGKETATALVSRSTSGYEYLDCEFEVVSDCEYKERKIWENLGVAGVDDKQLQGVRIAGRKLRAMVEASRNINPKDASPNAAQGRRLNSWQDLQGIEFPVVVDCEISDPSSKDGKRYVNNTIKKIVTPDMPEYADLMNGAVMITDAPLPEIPAGSPGQTTAKPAAQPSAGPRPPWSGKPQGAPQQQQAQQPAAQQPAAPPPPQQQQRPAWGRG